MSRTFNLKNLKIVVLYLLIHLLSLSVQAADGFVNRVFRRYDPTRLPAPFVRAIHQDKTGFLWLGTRAGLCRFDGEQYQHFRPRPGDKNSVSNHYIRSIWEDDAGNLWLGTFGSGLSCFHPASGKFTNFPLPRHHPAGRIHQVLGDGKGRLWLATEGGGLLCFLIKEKRYSFIRFPASLQKQFSDLRSILAGKEGDLWIGGTNGLLFRYFPQTNRYQQVHGLPLTTVWEMEQTSDSSLALATLHGLYSLNLRSLQTRLLADIHTRPALPSNLILTMEKDKLGNLWLGTAGGLAIFHPKKNKTELFRANTLLPHHLPDERILGLHQDQNGLMWIGTWNEGIVHTPVQPSGFILAENTTNEKGHPPIANLQKLSWANDRQALLASTWHGMLEAEPFRETSQLSLLDSGLLGAIPTNRLWGVLHDSRNRTWIGTHYQGVYLSEKGSAPFRKVDTLPGFSSRLRFASEIIEDRKGRIWVGTFGHGIALWNEESKSFRVFSFQTAEGKHSPALNQINIIRQAPDGMLWLGCNGGGLIVFHPENHDFQIIVPQPDGASGFNGIVLNIAFTGQDAWLSTEGGGLFHAGVREPSRLSYLNQKIGLEDHNLPVLQTDATGNLWLAGNGLYRIQTAGVQVEKISSCQRFHSTSLLPAWRYQSAAISKDGWLAFGANQGLLFFHPAQLNLPGPPRMAMSLMPEDFETLPIFLPKNQELRLKSEQENFSLQMANLNFFGRDKSVGLYRLEGWQRDYQVLGSGGMANFPALEPGTYRLSAFWRNEAGLDSEECSMQIVKLPFWWQTTWFKLTRLFLMLNFFGLVLFWRIRRTRRKEQEKARAEREKLELKIRALQSRMNPHFMFNALNSIDHYIWQKDVQQASEYLSRFSRLMRQVLEYSGRNSISLEEELTFLKLYIGLEQMRMEDAFESEVKISPESSNLANLFIAPMLLQPFVENAILHGLKPLNKKGKLRISIQLMEKGQQLLVCIEDNGIGREASRKVASGLPDSMGISLTAERIRQLNPGKEDVLQISDLSDAKGNPCGTRVCFFLPYLQHSD